MVTPRGARLDAIADGALLVSAAAWLSILQPRLLSENLALLTGAAALYATSTAVSWFVSGRLVDPRQVTAKLAGGLLYAFALITLLAGIYEPLLLKVAVAALALACLESLVAAIRTIHASGRASMIRSHRPQAVNAVGSSAAATTSITASAAPVASESAP